MKEIDRRSVLIRNPMWCCNRHRRADRHAANREIPAFGGPIVPPQPTNVRFGSLADITAR